MRGRLLLSEGNIVPSGRILIDNGKFYDQELSLVLISELGVFPPGSVVLLINGEIWSGGKSR